MCREGPCRPRELSGQSNVVDEFENARHAVHKHGDFFAKRRRRRRLAVGAGQHRGVTFGLRQFRQGGHHSPYGRPPHLADRGSERDSVGKVVDVLACAGEVRQLGDAVETQSGKVFTNQVLHRLHVVTGHGLEFGDARDIGVTEVRRHIAQREALLRRELGTKETLIRETNQPFDFDMDTSAVESRLRKVFADFGHRRVITTIERTERLRRKGHVSILAVFSPGGGGNQALHRDS